MSECHQILQQIATLFTEQLHLEVSSPETDLIDTGILDSLKFVELMMQLEQRFGTRVELNDLEPDNFRTLRRIAEFIEQRKAQRPGAV